MSWRDGDDVIFIDDEGPRTRAERKGEKVSPRIEKQQKARGVQKVGFFDKVDKVSGKRATFLRDKGAAFDAQGEVASSRASRVSNGEPARNCYLVRPEWFALPKGMQGTIASIVIDPETEAAIKRYHNAEMQKRGENDNGLGGNRTRNP